MRLKRTRHLSPWISVRLSRDRVVHWLHPKLKFKAADLLVLIQSLTVSSVHW